MEDLVVGQIVEAEVELATVFGLFCRCAGHVALVLIPETSWITSFSACDQFAAPGDRFAVKILHMDRAGRIAASIRIIHPDPWPAGRLEVGAVFQARVVRFVPAADRCADQPAYLVELLPGAYAMLCAAGLALQPGQRCPVRIVRSEPRRRAVTLEALRG
jgi:predicted RNA-binding protein with RPS1 domain